MADQIHDKGYKRILSQKKQFLLLLKNYIEAPWVHSICEEDMELIDKEFILLVDVRRYDDDWLKGAGGLLAAVFILDGLGNDSELSRALGQIQEMYSILSEDEKIAFIDWMKDVLIKKVPPDKRGRIEDVFESFRKGSVDMTYAIERIMDSKLAEGKIEGKIEGKLEGKLEGKIEGKIEDAVNIVKMLNVPVSRAMQIVNLSEVEEGQVIEELNRQSVPYTL